MCSRVRQVLLVTVAVVPMVAAWAGGEVVRAPSFMIESTARQRVVAVLGFSIHCPDLVAREWSLAVAAAPELPSQSHVKTTLTPTGVAVREAGALNRGMLTLRLPVKKKDDSTRLSVQVTYEATLHARTLRPAAGGEAGKPLRLSSADRERFTAERGDCDFKHERFKKWLKDEGLQRGRDEGDLDFARRAFLTLRQKLTYEYRDEMDRKASTVCFDGKSDCGGLAGLLVAVLRSNGVPARTLYGRWAQSAVPNDRINQTPYYQWHVKAECFADGVGWVPMDLSAGIVFDRSAEGLRFFGQDAGDFLTFHVDTHLQVNSGLFGLQTISNMQGPAWWAAGQGSTKPVRIEQSWSVKAEPQK